jgi:two-component system cell cycle sensor histidine kinase/response regulator CckA
MTPWKGGVILVVEDNPITRRMLRVALESEGYEVLEAANGRSALESAADRRPDLVVLDYVLPDMDGLALLAELRRRTGAPEIPGLLVTGMVSRLDELRARAGEAVQVLPKPLEPSRLLEIVRTHMTVPEAPARRRRLLVIDDEPLNLDLAKVQLEHAGYEVETASGGQAGLEKARLRRPDAVLTDVLMPSMDGFGFCKEVRRDPHLAATPVVLVSAAYAEKADRELAHQVGAHALVVKSPDLREAIEAVEQALRAVGPTPPPAPDTLVDALHRERLQVQLDQQTARNKALAQQTAIQAAALSVMRGLSQALAHPEEAPRVVGDVLVYCLDATGLSTGLLYVMGPGGRPRLEAQFGIAADSLGDAGASFGHPDLIRRIVESGQPVALSIGDEEASPEAREFRSCLGRASALLIPFMVLAESFGVLVLASDTHDLSESTWMGFAGNLAAQFGQTVALGQSLSRLAASEGRHRALMEQANDAILILDLPHRILDANREAVRLLGYPRGELVGRHFDELVVPEEREDSARSREAFLAEGTVHVEGRNLLRSDGRTVPVDVSASLVRFGGETGDPVVLAILRDITERKQAEAALRRSEEQYRLLFDSNPHPMWVFDEETLAFLAVNDAAIRHYGYSREEFLGMTIKDIRPPEDVPELLQALLENPPDRQRSEIPGHFKHRRKDGTVFQVEIARSPIRFRGRGARLVLAMDVTEKRSLEAQLLQSQKMESVGRLAGGVAHDFNNILGVISGYGELLRRRLPDDPHLRKYADDVLKAAQRAAGLTRQLLAFSRRQVLLPQILDLNGVVSEMEKMLRRLIGEDVQLVTALDTDPVPIKADPGQLEQVLMNLVVNARDAMPQGGRLVIETGIADFDERYAATHAGVQPGRYATLAVSDTGHGMSREVQARIFEPFFTTKDPGKGTGLGLATVHGIVKQSGGHVFVYSEPDKGSTFKVYLPTFGESPAAAGPVVEKDAPSGTETVLVVEDEASLRQIVRECLEEVGYTVLEAPDGLAALELAERHRGPIPLLITDVVMPGLGGRELARRLTEKRPDTKVLYMSGYTDDAVILHGVLTADMPFLEKPFTPGGLARKVREVLDRK